ncbi:MAG: YncE family protein [Elusimicrobiota bacterium]
MTLKLVLSLVAAWLLAGPLHAETAAGYKLKTQYKLGGEGGWDYLVFDASGKRLFISHATKVVVVNAADGSVAGEIPGTAGVHGIALAPDLGKGFTSNGKDNSVTVFDLKTLKVLSTIKIKGENPDCILYDPATKRVFTFNGKSHDATVIDADKGQVVSSISLDGKPEFAAADGKGGVFVNIEDKNELVAIDAAKAEVAKKWPLAPCDEPSGLTIDAKNRRLFAVCHNKLAAVVDADTGKIVATPAIGSGVDAAAYDDSAKLLFTSNGEGTMTVIHEDSADVFTVVENAKTQKGARTLALDPESHDVYLVTADMKEDPAAKDPRQKRTVLPGTFRVLVMTNDSGVK